MKRRSAATRIALAALLSLYGCGSEPASPPHPPSPAPSATTAGPAPTPATPPAALLADADARRASDALRSALAAPDAAIRATATLALARLHDPDVYPSLERALRDPDPSVREHASLGIGALEDEAPDEATTALLGALAAETDPAARGRLLHDLGRLATDEALAALPAALASEDAAEREGACLGLANAGLRGRSPATAILRRAADRVADDPSREVRLACAHALARLPAVADPADASALAAELTRGLDAPDPDVRAMSVRALARHPGVPIARLATAAEDPDWTVAVHAVRALAQRAAAEHVEPLYAQRLSASLDALLVGRDVAAGPPLHVFLATVESASPMARHAAVHEVARAALDRLARVPPDLPATRDRGLAHCAVARLVDLGRGWPSRVESCGLEQVSDAERRVLAAQVLAEVEGSAPQRGVYLQRLLRDESPLVREAAISAMGTLDSRESLLSLLTTLRTEDDPGVTIATLEALRAAGSRRASRLAAMVLAGQTSDDGWPVDDVVAALRASGARLIRADDLEGVLTWLATARELAAVPLAELAAPLSLHANGTVRRAARELLADAHVEPPAGEPAAPANPLDADAIASAPGGRVMLETDRGPVVIELWSDRAPTTVARFVGLVREGFFDGLTFHRVVPAFVVQGGDPRGDGYGGPGWAQRCEDHRGRYERGTVGMALAGRDTGGSQFFVTVAPQPHLDARYTAFGRVVEGMDNVDRLQAGDRIRHATFTP